MCVASVLNTHAQDRPATDVLTRFPEIVMKMLHRAPLYVLTHWGLVTHICVGKLISIGSDNGLSPGRRQAIIWTSAGILLLELDPWEQTSVKF